ncbi:leucine-rich repeat-domain-containing protein [Phyllosticta citriasiana]|uniref:leucine-rich repeat-domain-containing protein n=1 Tax=Phyllosticta citriasiana TaxID=595635 RepID=UPI0030FDE819
MRLSAELIGNALSYINPLGERELLLRGHQITVIENMGTISKDVECIDFVDNRITVLGNFPKLPRVCTLLIGKNRLQQIQPTIAEQLPSLMNLMATDNKVKELADLDPLGKLQKLTSAHLMGNPVTSNEHYRLWMIWRCKNLHYLDCQRVTQSERQEAVETFGTEEEPTELAMKVRLYSLPSDPFRADPASVQIMSKRSTTIDTSNGTDKSSNVGLTKLTGEEREKIKELLKNAKTLDEVARLQQMIESGKISL